MTLGSRPPRLPFIVLLALAVQLPSCARDKPDPGPNQEDVSRAYCEVFQTCDPRIAFDSQEACEAYSAEAFAEAEAEDDQECIEARLGFEACLGDFETCEDYEDYGSDKNIECGKKWAAFQNYCEVM